MSASTVMGRRRLMRPSFPATRSPDRSVLLKGVLLLAIAPTVLAQDPRPPCVSRAEAFIRAFGPPAGSDRMRTYGLEQAEEVYAAFFGIDRIRAGINVDGISEHEREQMITTYEGTIRNYMHVQSNEAMILASLGQASDLEKIGKALMTPLSIARQDGLMGHEELAREAQRRMNETLSLFSEHFAEECNKQTYDPMLALQLERQNELQGTGVSVVHCIERQYTADLESQGVHYHFETCVGLNGNEPWALQLSGAVTGRGTGTPSVDEDGNWSANTVFRGLSDTLSGSLQIVHEERTEQPAMVNVPKDASPYARPNNCVKEKSPELPPARTIVISKVRMRPIKIDAGRGYMGNFFNGAWIEAEVKTSGKSCQAYPGVGQF